MSVERYWDGSQWAIMPTIVGYTGSAGAYSAIGYTGSQGSPAATDFKNLVAYAVAGGTVNAYTATLSPAMGSYVDGNAIAIKINITNTTASTININGLGAIPIKDSRGNALILNKLMANSIYTMRYNGTNFILQGEVASGNAVASDLLSGKTASTDAGDITGTLSLTGDAIAGNVLESKTFYSNNVNSKITGTMVNRSSAYSNSDSTDGTSTVGVIYVHPLPGFYDGSATAYVKANDANWIAANIKKGSVIFNLTGTSNYYTALGVKSGTYVSSTSITFNISTFVTGYASLTMANFSCMLTYFGKTTTTYTETLTWSYTAATGIITCTASSSLFNSTVPQANITVLW